MLSYYRQDGFACWLLCPAAQTLFNQSILVGVLKGQSMHTPRALLADGTSYALSSAAPCPHLHAALLAWVAKWAALGCMMLCPTAP